MGIVNCKFPSYFHNFYSTIPNYFQSSSQPPNSHFHVINRFCAGYFHVISMFYSNISCSLEGSDSLLFLISMLFTGSVQNISMLFPCLSRKFPCYSMLFTKFLTAPYFSFPCYLEVLCYPASRALSILLEKSGFF